MSQSGYINTNAMKAITKNMTFYKKEMDNLLLNIVKNFEELSKYYVSDNSKKISYKENVLINRMNKISSNIEYYIDEIDNMVIKNYIEMDKNTAQAYIEEKNDIN